MPGLKLGMRLDGGRYLGGKLLITHLGEEYVSRMFATYAWRVPAEADLVCSWFEKAS